jgi:hypothetical protein
MMLVSYFILSDYRLENVPMVKTFGTRLLVLALLFQLTTSLRVTYVTASFNLAFCFSTSDLNYINFFLLTFS